MRNNPDAEANAAALLDAWRRAGRPLFHVQHLLTMPGSVFERTAPDGRRFTAEEMHDVNVASLNGEFASVITTQELLDGLR